MRQTRTFARFTSTVSIASLEESSAAVLRAEEYEAAFPLSANAPLRLDDPDTMWIVTSGEVDVFHVRSSSDAYFASRRYVATLSAGEVVVGASPTENDDGILIAVGFGGAKMQAVVRPALDSITGEGVRIARAIAVGAGETIGRAMYRESRATARPIDVSQRRVTVEPGGAITAAHDVVWIRIESGDLKLGGDIYVGGMPLFFPLARGMWFNAGAQGAVLSVADTFTAFASKRIAESIEYIWSVFLAWLAQRAEIEDATERGRLARKIEGERTGQAHALASLIDLLQGRGDDTPLALQGDALLDACAIVGKESGIAFATPPKPKVPYQDNIDPLDPYRESVMRICNASRVRYRGVSLRGEWWKLDAGPLLAFQGKEATPVALISHPAGGYTLHNPVQKTSTPVNHAVAATLLLQAYTFYQPAPAGAINWWALGKMLAHNVGSDFKHVLIYVVAGAVLGLAMPVVTGMMFNSVIPSAAVGNAVTLFGALLAVAIATASIDIARAFALIRVEGKSNSLLQAAIVDRLLALPPQFFRQYSVGDLALRAEAVNNARQAITGVALTSLFGGALVITSFGLMFVYSAKLALVAVAIVAVSAIVTAAVGIYALPYERRRHELMGKLSTLVFEMLSGIAKLHVAAAERRMFALWGAKFRELKVVSFRSGVAAAALAVFNTMLPVVAAGAVFVVAAKVIAAGGLTTGSFIAFSAAFGSALAAGIGVSTTLVSILNIVPLFERAAPILAAEPEVSAAKPDVGQISGRIELSQVTFGYIQGAPPVLEDVSLEIRPGEFVAFVGPSGSGKSTILRLMLGFEHPTRGAVYFDGHDLASIDVGSIRRQCAVVLQNSKLLVGDIFTNIVGASSLTHEDAWRAAEMAGLADDINAMPMGMHTVISEGGSTLSGGQRQRLLIARALVRRPRIVFFDEATSALDNRSQDIVTRSLESMEATRIVIAHRLTTVQRADRIFVIEKGRVVQTGTYDDLLSTEGLFKDLAERQLV